ncbi:adenosine kinase [Nordella sp. HKS 07]|uniref:adenosine kinase n=1 Tax=Nordella sp. HKS 07 TaxID=2712222 RepID=UPI0013E167A2|nr:adenosine kinase [Nordella sp. HKS 07]QIG48795.1 adenosine kinase [Nordella sp. HKS 07]
MTQPTFDVLTIGNAIVDVFSRVDEGFLTRHNVTKGMMRLVSEKESAELFEDMGPSTQISGGSGANTAVGVASFGGKVAFIGKVKADALGRVFSHDTRSAGVHFETPHATAGPTTASSLILITPDGERTMNTFLGACVHLSPGDIDEAIVSQARVTYLEGYLWDPPLAKQAFKKAARIARDAGRLVSITLSDSFCVDRHRDSFLDLIRNDIDIVFANEKEITSLYQVEHFDEALQRVRKDCAIAALTRSEAGCVIVKGDEIHVVEAHPVEKLVDATGAGDLFASGFLYGFTRDLPLVQCARLGALAAAEVISHVGARPELSLNAHAKAQGLL